MDTISTHSNSSRPNGSLIASTKGYNKCILFLNSLVQLFTAKTLRFGIKLPLLWEVMQHKHPPVSEFARQFQMPQPAIWVVQPVNNHPE